MMRLKHMVRETNAVAAELLHFAWECDQGSVEFHRASSNFVHRFTAGGNRRFLRLSHEEERNESMLQSELELLSYLRKSGYAAAYPVLSRHGRWLERLEYDLGVVFENANRLPLAVQEMCIHHFQAWGRALGKLHAFTQGYTTTQARATYSDHLDRLLLAFARWGEVAALEAARELTAALHRVTQTNENYGLVHYDFQYDNIFWNQSEQAFWVIDFDDAHYHFYAMDIVYALEDLPGRHDHADCQAAFLDGYQSIKETDQIWMEGFSLLSRYAQLMNFYRIMRSLESSSDLDDPDWLIQLRPRLLAKCAQLRRAFGR